MGFIAGLWCPGKVMQFGTAGQVLFNLLTAHVEVYKALKAMPGGDAACIGLVHQVRQDEGCACSKVSATSVEGLEGRMGVTGQSVGRWEDDGRAGFIAGLLAIYQATLFLA